jgi:hypothetical protein
MLATEPCDAVRFLTKTEARALEFLVESDSFADRLPLSLLRCEVFGAAQARITQGLRRRLKPADFIALIDDSIALDYETGRSRFAVLAGHIERLLLASFHALAVSGRTEAITVLLRLRPDIDFSPLAAHFAESDSGDDNVVSLAQHGVAARFAMLIETTDGLPAPLQAFVAEARTAFGSLSRQGFRDKDLYVGPVADGFAGGEAPLFKLRTRLAGFGQSLARAKTEDGAWQAQFESDRSVFLRQFHSLYGAEI